MADAQVQHERVGSTLDTIAGVRVPHKPSSSLWDIAIKNGRIASVDPHKTRNASSQRTLDGGGRLIAPSLCHSHIHLDKCFLLQDPKFHDLQLESGDFSEAMELTGEAKSRFDEEDLLRRGRQLILESICYGVTVMRAFVEVDGIVQLKCLHAGLKLKHEFQDQCEVQLCAFAQLPLHSGPDGGAKVRELMRVAASYIQVGVLGSTAYVEESQDLSAKNVQWIAKLALEHNKHLDIHLDYFIEEKRQPMIWTCLEILKEQQWLERGGKTISFGHCTRLTRFQREDWRSLRSAIGELPISFTGLPYSDLFIMKTPDNVRGTLPVTTLINEFGLNATVAINNVGNAFTPTANCDPLDLARLGVGLYHAGTRQDTELLYETVSSRAKTAIGVEKSSLSLRIGEPADFVLFDRMDVGWRSRKSISEIVYDAGHSRQTIYHGRVTAWTASLAT
ncbi:cytosine deaminase protein-like protein [Plenodomus tracheiphilus IPT5]|uniref:Cytosine deaminase protein-like protein n=1 Tax=Plenodomus tracheiphilus IPT5 TaxID=1408161 RepID=A0A6A7AP87_9PLEO|nr:cytosine deaminase protein-like protein [Plenodomus tracheiphilus IPT5]